jgi:FkbM family methyltransferase
MKNIIKNIIYKVIKPIALKVGFQKIDTSLVHNKENLLNNLFMNFKSIGFNPQHIIDIGANHGTWTREVLKYDTNSYFTLIEPQNWLRKSFQDLLDSNNKIKYLPVGAGKKNGSFKFTIMDRDDSCSFKFSEEEAKDNGYKQIEIKVITLNDYVKDLVNIPYPDLIKIDAEGLDIEVLEGASDLMGKTEVFMVEVGVVNKSFDNSIKKMINYMDENGYNLFDITDLNRPFDPSVLWLMELVFVKKGGIIDSYKFDF